MEADEMPVEWFINLMELSKFLQPSRILPQRTDEEMFGRRNILTRIEHECLQVIDSLFKNKQPLIIIPNRKTKQPTTKKITLNFKKEKSIVKFAQFIFTLSQIYNLLLTDKMCTKRDLFYQNVVLFKRQTIVDDIIDDIACWFHVPRNFLHVVATAKGLVAGDLKFYDVKGEFVNCCQSQGFLIPHDVERFSNFNSSSRFVLIVEKDAIFHKLMETSFTRKLNCLLITGKGFPDLSTRQLVAKIWFDLGLPILVLVDCDTYGIEIMCVYRFGSLNLQHESGNLVPPNVVRWLGLFPDDVQNLGMNCIDGCVVPLTRKDRKVGEKLIERMKNDRNDKIVDQIEILLSNNQKAEIEALDKLGMNYLSNVYLPNKIRFGGWI